MYGRSYEDQYCNVDFSCDDPSAIKSACPVETCPSDCGENGFLRGAGPARTSNAVNVERWAAKMELESQSGMRRVVKGEKRRIGGVIQYFVGHSS